MSDEMPSSEGGKSRDDFLTRIVDQLLDLLQTARDWIRQEAEATVKEKIVPPLQKLGLALASAFGAATLFVLGVIFVAVAALVALSQWLGVPLAFLIVGAVLLLGSAIFTAVKVRSMQG
jgi:hypothetical protein